MGVPIDKKKEYYAWIDMRRRCNNPKHPNYKNYGGRGICVCEKWNSSFVEFFADVGKAPDTTYVLDRIDNNGSYVPENVKWSNPKESTNNRRTTRHVVVDGVRMAVEDAAIVLGCTGAALRDRLRRGATEDEAGLPPKVERRKYTIGGQSMHPTQWAKHYGIPVATVNTRLRRGWDIEEALNLKPRKEK